MATIAILNKTETNDFEGHIETPLLNFPIKIESVTEVKTNEKQPDFTVFVDGFESGAGWNKIAKSSGKEYISVTIDDSNFPAPLYAKLNEVDGKYKLIWSR